MTIDELSDQIDAANADSLEEAQKNFTEVIGRELSASCDRLVKETRNRIDAIKRGEPPRSFGAYDRDEIARVFSTDMFFMYDIYEINYDVDVETIDDWRDGAFETAFSKEADEAYDREAFINCYEEYLYIAATFAKSIGSVAVRPYLMAWGLSRETKLKHTRLRLGAQKALRMVNLEKAASKLLWLDVTIARLPEFKATKPRRKAAPARKATPRKRKA